MFDIFYSGPKPNLFPHEQPVNSLAEAKEKSRTKFLWFIDGQYDYRNFDFSWFPEWSQLGQTHYHLFYSQFEQFQAVFSPAEITPVIENWHDRTYLARSAHSECWRTINHSMDWTLDTEWCPNPYDPDFIYVLSNKWGIPVLEYVVPGATEYKYVTDVMVTLSPCKDKWTIPEEVVQDSIDFSWVPHPKDPPYIYHFGSEFQESVGLLYTVPGATELKFMGDPPTKDDAAKVVKAVDIFFVDMNNKSSTKRFADLQLRDPTAQKIRYMNGWIETIKRCATRASTSKFWVVSSENVYTDFNFEWHAEPWQNFMLHVFGSQWQKWSDTFLINKHEFARHSYWAKSLEEFPNLHFVQDQKVYRPDDLYDIYYVNHSNPESESQLLRIQNKYPEVKVSRYVDNYLDTFKRIMATVDTEFVWIINSICDYSKFDFTWQPEPWQAKMLHVFPSNEQKFGDTFYIHVPTFKAQMDSIALLDWFETVHYCSDQIVPRYLPAIVEYTQDSVVNAIVTHEFTGPYAFFRNQSNTAPIPAFSPSLWRKKDKNIHVFSKSGSVVAVPRDAKSSIKTQAYDYPYIMPHHELYTDDTPLDIVYISNGEPDAQRWYDHLLSCAANTNKLPKQKIHRVKDVPGRSAAYKAAANASTTPWFFAVFAKLEVNPEFEWDWQPDYLQEPKHYIFEAYNPVNGLIYGHQACIAYNKKLVLETDVHGLDFTLSQKHEVVELLSGTAHFNVDPWTTWRTAFREVLKLKEYSVNVPSDTNAAARLQVWLTVAEGENAAWSLRGANDAIEYYTTISGEYSKLLFSFEWEWLREFFNVKYVSTLSHL